MVLNIFSVCASYVYMRVYEYKLFDYKLRESREINDFAPEEQFSVRTRTVRLVTHFIGGRVVPRDYGFFFAKHYSGVR